MITFFFLPGLEFNMQLEYVMMTNTGKTLIKV